MRNHRVNSDRKKMLLEALTKVLVNDLANASKLARVVVMRALIAFAPKASRTRVMPSIVRS
jgi:hypothetical protein